MDVLDHENVHRFLRRFQLRSQLFLHGGEHGRRRARVQTVDGPRAAVAAASETANT
jgi:hypothetical protein